MTRPTPPTPVPSPSAPPSPPLLTAADGAGSDGGVEIVESRHPGPHAFLLKARASGRFYQVAPARDPRQPRFWCVVVYRCSSAGLADTAERPWVGPGGFSRDDLSGVMEGIKADLGAWLATEPCRDLRRWLLEPAAESPAAVG